MAKRWAVLVGLPFLIFGFQNCVQTSLQSSKVSSLNNEVAVTLPSAGGGEGVSESAKVTYVEIPNISENVGGAIAKSTDISPYRLVIAASSGRIQLVDQMNSLLEERCLSEDDLNELKNILSGASVCAAPVQEADMCAMRYTPAYASLYANEKRVNLGEERDSCGTGRQDLCGALADVFQAYVAHIRANWADMSCE